MTLLKTLLTPRQQEVLDFLRSRIEAGGVPPTLEEMAAHFGVARSTVAWHLEALRKKGRLTRDARARNISLTPRPVEGGALRRDLRGVYLPEDGLAGCDPERIMTFTVDDDSMFDLGIHCGDTVLAVPVAEKPARPGDVVLARFPGGRWTVRSYFPINRRYFELVPARFGFYEKRFRVSSKVLRGVVVALVRRY